MKKIKNNKNISRKIPNGTVILTRDEFFEDNNNYIKDKYKQNRKYYREATVIDSNRRNELAIIKHQSSGLFSVKNNVGQLRKYNTYIKIKDNNGNPIKLGIKFIRGPKKYDVKEKYANDMKKRSLLSKNKKIANQNIKVLRELKERKK